MTSIDVCIPTHNRPEYFKEAVESVLKQSFQDFQIHVSDNSDNNYTANYIKSLNSHKIHYLKVSADTSPTSNQANSAQMGKSQLMTFLTDDDTFHLDYLAKMYKTITHSKASLVRSGGYYIDSQSQVIGDFLHYPTLEIDVDFIKSRIEQRIISGLAGYIFRRKDYQAVGGLLDVGFAGSLYADDYLWFRLVLKSGCLALSNGAVWYWRKHDNNVGSKLDLERFIVNTSPYVKTLQAILPEHQNFDKIRELLKNRYKFTLINSRLTMELARLKNIHHFGQYFKYLIKYRKYLHQQI